MRFAHISDLHLGKRMGEYSLIKDQQYILSQIIDIIKNTRVDAIIISGDVYDKTVPSAEAVTLCDDFFTKLSTLKIHVFVISGNHDSAERLSFGSRIMENMNIHISPVFDGNLKKVVLKDEYGAVNVYLMPFIKPSSVRRFFPDTEITNYTDAVRAVIDNTEINTNERNIIAAHQFVTGAKRCESEEITVGGLDNVDSSVFDKFDYTALGHIHTPQTAGKDTIRYCGTPLKYSFSEASDKKSVTILDIFDKTDITINEIPLTPLFDVRKIKGSYETVTARSNYINTNTNDYVYITLTDEQDIPGVLAKLRTIYPNIVKMDYDNKRTKTNRHIGTVSEIKKKSPLELFEEFYELQNNVPMDDEQKKIVTELIEEIWR